MRHEFVRQAAQARRQIGEIADADADHQPAGRDQLAIVELHRERIARAAHLDDLAFLHLGHEKLLKRAAIGNESLARHRTAFVGIGNALAGAEGFEREFVAGIGQVGGKAL